MPIKLKPGETAPDFDLPLAGGGSLSLSELRGHKAIIYFYPAASTPLCTTQTCDLRDNHQRLQSGGFKIIGISPDNIADLEKFSREHELSFPLLGDPNHEAMRAWGTFGEKNMYGKIVEGTIRSTFAIDEDGKILLAKYRVKTPGHVDMLCRELAIA